MSLRWIFLILCVLLMASRAVAAEGMVLSEQERAWVASHPVVRIQMSSVLPPFEFRHDGRWQGLAYDHLMAACEQIGLRVEVTGLTWTEALGRIGAGDGVDLLLAVTSSPERARQMLLTRPYLAFPQVIIADRNRAFISALGDLRTATIAVERDYVMAGWLRRDLPHAHLLVVDDTPQALAAVATGRAEAYVGNLAVASYLIERKGLVNLGVVAPSGYGDDEFAMGVRTDWPELVALLDRAFAEMSHDQRQSLRQNWLAVRYEHGLRYGDVLLWVLAVAGVALVFIVQLRRMVKSGTAELAREVALRREREANLAEAQRIAHLGSWTSEIATGDLAWSAEAMRIFAWSSERRPSGADHLRMVHPDDRDRLVRHQGAVLAGDATNDIEYRIIRPDGEVRRLLQRCSLVRDDQGTPVRVQCIVLDITERKRAEDERARLEQSLRHAEKLRMVGQLAGGIAHDFNNLLAGITGHAELLQLALATESTPRADGMRRHASGILTAAGRAAAITAQLRIHTRREAVLTTTVDLHALIHETVELVRRGTDSTVEIRLVLQAARYVVVGDAALIQTALANLALNARDAMPTGGTLTIATELAEIAGEPPGAQGFDLRPGPHIVIAIADTGIGMDEAVRSRLFEPFFTTKAVGRGTGLGLANVHACVRSHHGAIAVESARGKGTTFHVYLPLSAQPVVVAKTTGLPEGGEGRILLVDDDATLREVSADMLRALGYTVEVADGGEAAEALLRTASASFALVIVGMHMPGMDGEPFIVRLRAIDPEVRVLLCSGAFRDGRTQSIAAADGFLQKPYDLAELADRVASTMRRPGSS
jgi:PAS domain S-box-containing protein